MKEEVEEEEKESYRSSNRECELGERARGKNWKLGLPHMCIVYKIVLDFLKKNFKLGPK